MHALHLRHLVRPQRLQHLGLRRGALERLRQPVRALEARVGALTERRDHRVEGVAEERDRQLGVPREEALAHERLVLAVLPRVHVAKPPGWCSRYLACLRRSRSGTVVTQDVPTAQLAADELQYLRPTRLITQDWLRILQNFKLLPVFYEMLDFESYAEMGAILHAKSAKDLKNYLEINPKNIKINFKARKEIRELFTNNPDGSVASRFVNWFEKECLK